MKAHFLPFMLTIAGQIEIYTADGMLLLPPDWRGLCVDGSDVTVFWYIGQDAGERSFSRLQASSYPAALQEVVQRGLAGSELEVAWSTGDLAWRYCLLLDANAIPGGYTENVPPPIRLDILCKMSAMASAGWMPDWIEAAAGFRVNNSMAEHRAMLNQSVRMAVLQGELSETPPRWFQDLLVRDLRPLLQKAGLDLKVSCHKHWYEFSAEERTQLIMAATAMRLRLRPATHGDLSALRLLTAAQLGMATPALALEAERMLLGYPVTPILAAWIDNEATRYHNMISEDARLVDEANVIGLKLKMQYGFQSPPPLAAEVCEVL